MIDACNKVVDKGCLNIYIILFLIYSVSLKSNKINMSIPICVNALFVTDDISSPNSLLCRKDTITNEIHIIK